MKPRQPVAVEGPGLQPGGVGGGLVRVEGVDAAAAPQQGPQFHPRADAQAAGALGSQQALVAGKAQNVRPQGRHVQGDGPRRLGGVQDQEGPVGMGQGGDAGDIRHIAGDVGGVGAHHSPGVGPEQPLQGVIVQAAVSVRRKEAQAHALPLQGIQGPEHRVVLQVRGDGVVLRGQQAADGHIQGHGGVGGEGHMVWPGTAQQPGRQAPGIVHRPGGGHGGPVGSPGGVARRADGLRHRPGHLGRLVQGGGGAVQINFRHQNISNTQQGPWPMPFSSKAAVRTAWSPGAAFQARPHPAEIREGRGMMRPGRDSRVNRASAARAWAVS